MVNKDEYILILTLTLTLILTPTYLTLRLSRNAELRKGSGTKVWHPLTFTQQLILCCTAHTAVVLAQSLEGSLRD